RSPHCPERLLKTLMETYVKKLLLATTMLAISLTSAYAKVKEYYRSGVWTNYAGTSNLDHLVCGMTVVGNERDIHLKYYPETKTFWVQIFKASWRIPEGTKLAVEIGFDNESWGQIDTAEGTTLVDQGHRVGEVEFGIAPDSLESFLKNVSEANKMWVGFPDGNEETWVAKMDGSCNSVKSLMACADQMASKTTQPFNKGGNSQPFGAKPAVDTKKLKDNQI